MRTAVVVVLSLTLCAACKGDGGRSADGKAPAPSPAADAGKTAADDPGADADAAGDVDQANADTAAVADATGAAGPAGADTKADDTADAKADDGAGTGAAADAGAAEGDTGDAKDPAPDPKALLTEVKGKKTKDDRALAALAEAEAAGASAKDLAKAANARGMALYATPDRAKVFFEWALDKDPKYPDPAFNLAKQAVVLGEVNDTKKWLTETKNRGGKKLVAQVEFDPMWEIVADDPDVRALLKK